jgi:hypothetical protein
MPIQANGTLTIAHDLHYVTRVALEFRYSVSFVAEAQEIHAGIIESAIEGAHQLEQEIGRGLYTVDVSVGYAKAPLAQQPEGLATEEGGLS